MIQYTVFAQTASLPSEGSCIEFGRDAEESLVHELGCAVVDSPNGRLEAILSQSRKPLRDLVSLRG